MRVVVVGTGLMGAQIGCEYALGGHHVVCVGRRPEVARGKIADAFGVVERHGLAESRAMAGARGRVAVAAAVGEVEGEVDLVVESIAEDLDEKVAVLREAGERFPAAILASNTSSLSISELGEGAAAAERTVGTHYWNPPLLMPLVEVVRGATTTAGTVERVVGVLRGMGKRPVMVEREAPGFLWNRLQLALLREAVWLVEQGVASPETVDEVVRDGLARRWRYTGPFETAALGGAATFERIAANLFPVLSNADALNGLGRWLDDDEDRLAATRERRDRGLGRDLARDRDGVGGEGASGAALGAAGVGGRGDQW